MIILHFSEKQIWETEDKNNTLGESAELGHGFVPCFKISDLKTIQLQFSTLKDYVVLCINTDKLTSELKWEDYGETSFKEPNIYGPINKEAVITVLPYAFDREDHMVLTPEILALDLINEALISLNVPYESHKFFHDGTDNTIILINEKYVVKKADPAVLKAAIHFAKEYQDIPMLQKIAYAPDDGHLVIYHFVPGDVMHTVTDFDDLSTSIKRIVNSYHNVSFDGYGYTHAPVTTWDEFLRNEVSTASNLFHEADYLLEDVNQAINELAKIQFDKKLIHGDFGSDNFIAYDDKFVAAIDPIPVAGDKLYDLLYALVSNIDLLPYLSIDFLTSYTGEAKTKVIHLLKVVLYCRICKCAVYNKDWIESYLEFWEKIF